MYAWYPEATSVSHLLPFLKTDLFHSHATSHLLEHSFLQFHKRTWIR